MSLEIPSFPSGSQDDRITEPNNLISLEMIQVQGTCGTGPGDMWCLAPSPRAISTARNRPLSQDLDAPAWEGFRFRVQGLTRVTIREYRCLGV
jgi:hypothetical protein